MLDAAHHSATIDVTLEHGDNLQVKLRIMNKKNEPVSLTSYIDDILKWQFQEFPVIGLLQLRSRNKTDIRDIAGETPDGWVYPNLWNSVILNPQFGVRGEPTPAADSLLHTDVLPVGETIIAFDCQMVLLFVSNIQDTTIESARVRIDIKIKGGKSQAILSDWFDIIPHLKRGQKVNLGSR